MACNLLVLQVKSDMYNLKDPCGLSSQQPGFVYAVEQIFGFSLFMSDFCLQQFWTTAKSHAALCCCCCCCFKQVLPLGCPQTSR